MVLHVSVVGCFHYRVVVFHCMNISPFVYPVAGHEGYFQYWGAINKATLRSLIQVFLCTYAFLGNT